MTPLFVRAGDPVSSAVLNENLLRIERAFRSEAKSVSGGGSSGIGSGIQINEHGLLLGLDSADQHPMSSITGLVEALAGMDGSDIVHKSGAEIITGAKTFTNPISASAVTAPTGSDLALGSPGDVNISSGINVSIGAGGDVTIGCGGKVSLSNTGPISYSVNNVYDIGSGTLRPRYVYSNILWTTSAFVNGSNIETELAGKQSADATLSALANLDLGFNPDPIANLGVLGSVGKAVFGGYCPSTPGTPGGFSIWSGAVDPSATNYALFASATQTEINATSKVYVGINNATVADFTATAFSIYSGVDLYVDKIYLASQDLSTTLTGLSTAISGKASTVHTNATGANIGLATTSLFGHAKACVSAGAAPTQAGAVGTDNGVYARGDHGHPATIPMVLTSADAAYAIPSTAVAVTFTGTHTANRAWTLPPPALGKTLYINNLSTAPTGFNILLSPSTGTTLQYGITNMPIVPYSTGGTKGLFLIGTSATQWIIAATYN